MWTSTPISERIDRKVRRTRKILLTALMLCVLILRLRTLFVNSHEAVVGDWAFVIQSSLNMQGNSQAKRMREIRKDLQSYSRTHWTFV